MCGFSFLGRHSTTEKPLGDCNDGHSVVSQFQLNGCILPRQTAVSTSTDPQSSVSLQSVPGALLLKGSQEDRCDATPESLSSYEMADLLHAVLTHYLSCTVCCCVYLHYTHTVTHEGQKNTTRSLELVTSGCKSPHGCWEQKPGLPEEQPVLLTTKLSPALEGMQVKKYLAA